jgi:pimeloyl-ACP methyl ester carboxylesterase
MPVYNSVRPAQNLSRKAFSSLSLQPQYAMTRWNPVKSVVALIVIILMNYSISPFSAALARSQPIETRRPLIFVPGLLGSRLCRSNPANPAKPIVLWGSLHALSQFPTLRLPRSETEIDDELKPCGLVREFVYLGFLTQRVYGPVIANLHRLGYREGRNLFVFSYDWRRSVFENAELLAAFLREKVPDGTQRVDILAHSMGGLVSRVYAVKLGGAARIATLMSAGTPFHGSVKVYETVEKGWGSVNYIMGGIGALRQTILSFPALFELMPRYGACCGGDQTGGTPFVPFEIAAWQSLGWDGVEVDSIPDLGRAFARVRELQNIVDTALPPDVEDVLIIGVDQRTSQTVAFERSGARTTLRVQTTWAGDGTVVRESAALPGRAIHPTSFADHDQILHDPQVQEFVRVALTRNVAEAMRTVKIRQRLTVRGVDGSPTELVGVAVITDQPIYQVGDQGKARVHFRLGTQRPLSARLTRLTFRTPEGHERQIALRPDPGASDPTNPFEQTFTGEFITGTRAGMGMLTAAVTVDAVRPRIVQRAVPIVAP